eukprot:scaffold4.g4782.t1
MPNSMLLREADAMGQDIFRHTTGAAIQAAHLKAADALEDLRAQLMESPIKPFWIKEADSSARAMPTPHESLVRWSAPCFITIRLTLAGLSFGTQTVESFTCCLNAHAKNEFVRKGERRVSGVDAAISCGRQFQDKADVLSAPSDDFGTVGVNVTRSMILHIGYGWGAVAVDERKNAEAYGPDAATAAALLLPSSKVPEPREMQALLGILNTCINTVERVTPPARVSASLERLTAGHDPDSHMILRDGTVIDSGISNQAAGLRRHSI